MIARLPGARQRPATATLLPHQKGSTVSAPITAVRAGAQRHTPGATRAGRRNSWRGAAYALPNALFVLGLFVLPLLLVTNIVLQEKGVGDGRSNRRAQIRLHIGNYDPRTLGSQQPRVSGS